MTDHNKASGDLPTLEEIKARLEQAQEAGEKLEARIEAIRSRADNGKGIEEELEAHRQELEIIKNQLQEVNAAEDARAALLIQAEQLAQQALTIEIDPGTGKKRFSLDLTAIDDADENPLRGMSVREWLEWQEREPEAANAAMQAIIKPIAGITPESLGGIDIAGLRPLEDGMLRGIQSATLATGIQNPFAEIQESLRPLREWQESVKPLTEGIAGLTVETEAMRTWRDSVHSIYKGIYDAIESIQGKMDWKKINAAQEALASMGRTIIETTEKINKAVSEPLQRLAQWADDVKEANEARAAAFNAGDYKTAFDGFADDIDDYLPYLIKAIEAYKKENGIDEITWYDFFQFRADTAGEPVEDGIEIAPEDEPQGIFYICMKRAIESKQLAEAAAIVMQEAVALQAKKPIRHTMPNNALANELQHGLVNAGEQNLIVSNGDRRRHLQTLTAYTMVEYVDGNGVMIAGNFTEYDRQVSDAILSLYLHGHKSHFMTADMIYRAMTTQDVNPSPQSIGAVTKSIEKMRRIRVTVDATEELRARGITDVNGNPITYQRDNYLLVATGHTFKAGGKIVKGYSIDSEPILYNYAKLTGQVLTVNANLLNICDVTPTGQIGAPIKNSEQRIPVKGYLLRRVEVMRHDKKQAQESYRKHEMRRQQEAGKAAREGREPAIQSKEIAQFRKHSTRIKFDTLYDEIGIAGESDKVKRACREYAMQVLDYWKAVKYIKGYSVKKGDKNKIEGVEILL